MAVKAIYFEVFTEITSLSAYFRVFFQGTKSVLKRKCYMQQIVVYRRIFRKIFYKNYNFY